MPTLALKTIWQKWRDILEKDEAIEQCCQSKYGKSLTVYVGINRKNPPKAENCPFAVILPGAKVEGEDVGEFIYSLTVGWAIANENMTGNELDGIGECDDLGQLILTALVEANPNYPASSINYDINPVDFFPQIVGEMLIELTITPVIGVETIKY